MNQHGDTSRIFVALPLAAGLRHQLTRLVQEMAAELEGVRWVRPENYHLTLRFLGDVSTRRVDELTTALGQEDWPNGFVLPVGQVGAFPHPSRARVIHVKATSPTLEVLHEQLERVLRSLGFPGESRFSGHITLGRVPRGGRVDLRKVVKEHAAGVYQPLEAERMVLFMSDLRPQGPVYRELASFALGLPVQTRSCYT